MPAISLYHMTFAEYARDRFNKSGLPYLFEELTESPRIEGLLQMPYYRTIEQICVIFDDAIQALIDREKGD
jgi:hypothetical protein